MSGTFFEGTTLLRAIADAIPRGSLVLIIGGRPCVQLTFGGPMEGRQGLCGPASVLFYAFPIIAYALRLRRPDCNVQVVVEIAGTTRPEHRISMQEALNLPTNGSHVMTNGSHVMTVDTVDWTHMPRKRLFLSTLPSLEPRWRPQRRPGPWEDGIVFGEELE